MRLDKDYCIYNFCGTDYLMPVGQNITDYRRGLRLNESSALLLRFLQEERSFDEVVKMFAEYYKILPENIENLKNDLNETIGTLVSAGYLFEKTRYQWLFEERCLLKYKIASFVIGINGDPNLMHDFMKDFPMDDKENTEKPDQLITLHGGAPVHRINGTVILRNDDLIVMDAGLFYVFLFPGIEELYELHVAKSGSKGVCYYRKSGEEKTEELREQIFHALRIPFLLLAGEHRLYAVHSASLLYKDKSWLFSGQSGTGKSTHVALWQEEYSVPALNGDLNLIGIQDGRAVVYGIPWCGTSETYVNETYPLGGISFLRQARNDWVEEPESSEAAVLLLNRIIYPVWTQENFKKAAEFASEIVKKAKFFKVFCTKNKSAAIVVKEKIDKK